MKPLVVGFAGGTLALSVRKSDAHGPLVVLDFEHESAMGSFRVGLEPQQARELATRLQATAVEAEAGR